MKRNSKYSFCVWLLLVCVMTSFVMSFSGCTALKRKFVRKSQKEDKKEMFIPVLEPIEYPAVEITPKKTYVTHFVMMRSYYRDLSAMLGRGENDQRERYLLTQMSEKLLAMAQLLKEAQAESLKQYSQQIQSFFTELDKAPSMRRYDVMKNQLRLIEKDIVKKFKPSLISDDMFVVKQE